jgi:hypothetical protein
MKTILSTILSAAIACTAFAQVPNLINYQGRLTAADGAAVTGTKNFSISIYDAATAGNLLYTETIGAVTLDDNGVYSFQFGSAGTSDTQVTETIGTTAGSTLTYTKTLSNTPVVANSITVTDGTNSWSQSVGNPGVAATATASRASGFVIGAEITNGGSGYTSAPLVTVTGSGSGATATATLTGGVVTDITITSAGSGYSGGATITIAPPVIPFRVDYSGGAITATYSTAAAAGRTITATYRYGTSGITGALSSGVEHWMAVSVDSVTQGARQRVLAVPFAVKSAMSVKSTLAESVLPRSVDQNMIVTSEKETSLPYFQYENGIYYPGYTSYGDGNISRISQSIQKIESISWTCENKTMNGYAGRFSSTITKGKTVVELRRKDGSGNTSVIASKTTLGITESPSFGSFVLDHSQFEYFLRVSVSHESTNGFVEIIGYDGGGRFPTTIIANIKNIKMIADSF